MGPICQSRQMNEQRHLYKKAWFHTLFVLVSCRTLPLHAVLDCSARSGGARQELPLQALVLSTWRPVERTAQMRDRPTQSRPACVEKQGGYGEPAKRAGHVHHTGHDTR